MAPFTAFREVKAEFMPAPHSAWTAVGTSGLIRELGIDVPIRDRFQVISEHESTHLVIDPHYRFRAEDVFVNLIEVKRDNRSLGLGIAQFAP
jgi:hypothetical protein